MKKTLALLMTLAMMLSCIAGLAVNSSAAQLEYVEETYSYESVLEEVGSHDEGREKDADLGCYKSEEGFFLGNGMWTYEYWDVASSSFKPMSAYFSDAAEGGAMGVYTKYYIAVAEGAWDNASPYRYCAILKSGTALHPGDGADSALTYVVPATGTISYDVSVSCNNESNTSDPTNGLGDNWGSVVTVYLNDKQIWPAEGDTSNRIGYETNPADNPLAVSVPSFKVNEGDKVRLVVSAYNRVKSCKMVDLTSLPVITYHDAGELSVGDPKGVAPTGVMHERVSKETTDTIISWGETIKAVGYNVYYKVVGSADEAVKANAEPITDLTYTLTGLESDTMYELTVTSVTATGSESDPSDPYTFKTPKVEAASGSDKTSDGSSDASTPVASDENDGSVSNSNNSNANPQPSDGFPWWIIIVAAVVVIAIVVVLVLVLGKKKAPEATSEAAPAVEDAPEAEAAPAEEEKNDQE